MNEKQNRFIVSVATKNVLVFFLFLFLFCFVLFFFKKYPGHTSLTVDYDLEVNRNLNNTPNLFNYFY